MTPFAALQSLCGLSNREAADFLGVREKTVDDWRSGRRGAPEGAFADLDALVARQANAADDAAELIEARAEGAEIEIGYPADDAEAQSLGWPCVGAWRVMAGLTIAILIADGRDPKSIRLVPHGSTPASSSARMNASNSSRLLPVTPRDLPR